MQSSLLLLQNLRQMKVDCRLGVALLVSTSGLHISCNDEYFYILNLAAIILCVLHFPSQQLHVALVLCCCFGAEGSSTLEQRVRQSTLCDERQFIGIRYRNELCHILYFVDEEARLC